jgi:hypothetical protein
VRSLPLVFKMVDQEGGQLSRLHGCSICDDDIVWRRAQAENNAMLCEYPESCTNGNTLPVHPISVPPRLRRPTARAFSRTSLLE